MRYVILPVGRNTVKGCVCVTEIGQSVDTRQSVKAIIRP
jgi:hypothetical protein